MNKLNQTNDFQIEVTGDEVPFTMIENAILEDDRVSKHALLVYWVLCKFKNRETKECWPSLKTIAKLSRSSKDKVIEAIKELEDLGYIECEHRVDPENSKRNLPNLYTIKAQFSYEKKLSSTNDKKKKIKVVETATRGSRKFDQGGRNGDRDSRKEGQELDVYNNTNITRSRKTKQKKVSIASTGVAAPIPDSLSFLTKQPYSLQNRDIHTLLSRAGGDEYKVEEVALWWREFYYERGKPSNCFALMYRSISEDWDVTDDKYAEWGVRQHFGG